MRTFLIILVLSFILLVGCSPVTVLSSGSVRMPGWLPDQEDTTGNPPVSSGGTFSGTSILIPILLAGGGFYLFYLWYKKKQGPRRRSSRGEVLIRLVRKNGQDGLLRANSRQEFMDWYNRQDSNGPVWDTPTWQGVERIDFVEQGKRRLLGQ